MAERYKGDPNRIKVCLDACAGMKDPVTETATLRARVKELEEALKERRGYYYERDVPHQSNIPHCQCRKCVDTRCDAALKGRE